MNKENNECCDNSVNYEIWCEQLRKENKRLVEQIERLNEPKQGCCVSMDYEDGYHRLKEQYQMSVEENEKLKQALINIALKL